MPLWTGCSGSLTSSMPIWPAWNEREDQPVAGLRHRQQLRHPAANGHLDVRARWSRSRRRHVAVPFSGVDEVHEAVEHARRERAALRIPRDQLDVHRAERARDRRSCARSIGSCRSHTRMLPRSIGSPGTTFSELAGIMKSDVTIRLRSGRAEMPCGLKSCCGGSAGHSPTIRRCRRTRRRDRAFRRRGRPSA